MTQSQTHNDILRDQNSTSLATLTLLAACISQAWLAGRALYVNDNLFSMQGAPWPALPAIAVFGLLLYLAKGTQQHITQKAASGAGVLALLALPAAYYRLPWLGLSYLVGALVVLQGARALQRTHQLNLEDGTINPKREYTQLLLSILCKAMGADGHIDQREHRILRKVCAEAKLDTKERSLVMHHAKNASERPIGILVECFLDAAWRANIPAPQQHLLGLFREVIESDGIVVPEEASLLQSLGEALKCPEGEIDAYLSRVNDELATPSSQMARQILNLPQHANTHSIELAYATLARSIQEIHPQIEAPAQKDIDLPKYTEDRMSALRRAYDTLTTSPNA